MFMREQITLHIMQSVMTGNSSTFMIQKSNVFVSIFKIVQRIQSNTHFSWIKAVECPPAPYFQKNTPEGESTWDFLSDEPPLFSEVATYTCPEGHVFEIYQDYPNFTINFGLIEPETDTVNLTCEAFADWSPSEVPRCIRKCNDYL